MNDNLPARNDAQFLFRASLTALAELLTGQQLGSKIAAEPLAALVTLIDQAAGDIE